MKVVGFLFTLILLLNFNIKAQDVTIGTQTWVTKNLDVESYRNGDAIPQVQDKKAWANLTTGAWCYYEKNKANYDSIGAIYGKLYNWYAVNDPRGLAPKGYHVPTDEEWGKLTDNLGESKAGTKMKSITGWYYNDSGGSNTSGFAGLPGGYRSANGIFGGIGSKGCWWSSSEISTNGAWSRDLNGSSGSLDFHNFYKQNGFSVRCLRD